MSGRFQPTHGADSAEALVRKPFRVKVVDTEGPSWYIEVHAIGRHDAREQARAKAVEQGAERPGVLAIEEVAPLPEFVDVGTPEGKAQLLDAMLGTDR